MATSGGEGEDLLAAALPAALVQMVVHGGPWIPRAAQAAAAAATKAVEAKTAGAAGVAAAESACAAKPVTDAVQMLIGNVAVCRASMPLLLGGVSGRYHGGSCSRMCGNVDVAGVM